MVDIQSSHKMILWHNNISVNGIEVMSSIHQDLGFGQYSPIVKIPARNFEQGSTKFKMFKMQRMPETMTFWTPIPATNLFWMSANMPLKVSIALEVILEGQVPSNYADAVSKTIPQYIHNFELGCKLFNYEWAVLYINNSSHNILGDAVRELRTQIPFHLFDYGISEISQFPDDLMAHIGMSKQESHFGEYIDLNHFVIPKFPLIKVSLDEIGVAENVSWKYARSLIKGLVSTEIVFTVWIYRTTESITFDDAIIARIEENNINQKMIFHLAIEIQGYMYDCYKGFNGDIPLADFQNRITSDTRDQITVSSGLRDFEEIEKQIGNLIKSE